VEFFAIVYLIMLILLTQLVFLKTDLINFGEIKHMLFQTFQLLNWARRETID